MRLNRSLTKRLLLIALGSSLGLLVAELALRTRMPSSASYYQADPYCGARLRPGLRTWHAREGNGYVETNPQGHRDNERSIVKPENVVRIAVIGDSYAEALHVDRDEAFWAVLEKELNHRHVFAGMRCEVLNFSVSGYGTAQELQMLRHYVWPYKPDIVLLPFLTGNDIADNSPALAADSIRPFFQWDGEKLTLDTSFRQDPTYLKQQAAWTQLKNACVENCRLLHLAYRLKSSWGSSQTVASHAPTLEELGLDSRVYSPPQESEWKEAWEITEAILAQMQREVLEHNAAFWLVSLSNGIQVDPDKSRRDAFQAKHAVESLFYPDERIGNWCQTHNVPYLLLAPRLRRVADEQQVYLHGFENTQLGLGHWNSTGHATAGRMIADWIVQNRLSVAVN